LALLRQQAVNDIAGLILWQPVLNFSANIKQFMRRSISSQIAKGKKVDARPNLWNDLQRYELASVIGYSITRNLYNGFISIGTQPENVVPSVPTFILSISLMEQPVVGLVKHVEHLRKADSPVVFQHVIAEPFWDRYWQWECKIATNATSKWLRELKR